MFEIRLRRAGERFVSRSPGVVTRHVFSFGAHYDPAHVSHGPLIACDEHDLQPHAGFAPHLHRDVEVVSWVLEGELLHEGPEGTARVPVGTVQRLSAGSGVVHAERAGDAPTRFVQMWLVPGSAGQGLSYEQGPSYEQVVVPSARLAGELVPVASGLGHPGAAPLSCPAALYVARLARGRSVPVPEAAATHLLVVRGTVSLAGEELFAGDSARLAAAGALPVAALEPAEILVWEMHVEPEGTR